MAWRSEILLAQFRLSTEMSLHMTDVASRNRPELVDSTGDAKFITEEESQHSVLHGEQFV